MKQFEEFKAVTSCKFEVAEVAETKVDVPEPVNIMTSDLPISMAIADDMYPCSLAMLGSGFAPMKVGYIILQEKVINYQQKLYFVENLKLLRVKKRNLLLI